MFSFKTLRYLRIKIFEHEIFSSYTHKITYFYVQRLNKHDKRHVEILSQLDV